MENGTVASKSHDKINFLGMRPCDEFIQTDCFSVYYNLLTGTPHLCAEWNVRAVFRKHLHTRIRLHYMTFLRVGYHLLIGWNNTGGLLRTLVVRQLPQPQGQFGACSQLE
jgi:hypothetical protein